MPCTVKFEISPNFVRYLSKSTLPYLLELTITDSCYQTWVYVAAKWLVILNCWTCEKFANLTERTCNLASVTSHRNRTDRSFAKSYTPSSVTYHRELQIWIWPKWPCHFSRLAEFPILSNSNHTRRRPSTSDCNVLIIRKELSASGKNSQVSFCGVGQ